MNRSVLVVLGIVILCTASMFAVLVNAATAGYEITNFLATNDAVEDGKWTTANEWTDAATATNNPAAFLFREKWTYPSNIVEHVLIEFYLDNTNDTGDYFELCFDPTANGGTAPQTDDIRIYYEGHRRSGLTLYKGTGSGWAVWTGYTYGTDLKIAETLTDSPTNSTPHFVLELMMDRNKAEFDTTSAGYAPWVRVAVYDASNSAAGAIAWPPTARDAPSGWGLETGLYQTIPEFPSHIVGATILLISVAVAATALIMRKKTKPTA